MQPSFKRTLKRFSADRRGNVAIMFGLALIPLIGLTGVGVDYTRASQLRARMATASDAAVLVAVKSTGLTLEQRTRAADAVFAANLGTDLSLYGITGTLIKLDGNGYRYEANARYTYAVLKALPGAGASTPLRVFSEASAGDSKVEVALVLDNTGSMANDMAVLRSAAADFTNILFDAAPGTNALRMSVVPYVTAVNPGRMNLGMSSVDARGDSSWHAIALRDRYIGWIPNCNMDPYYVPGPPGPPGPTPPPDPYAGPGRGGRGVWLQDALRKLASVGQELFGISSAAAQVGTYGTPNRTAPWSGTNVTISPPYTAAPVNALIPTGFSSSNPCVLNNPSKISHLDLFDGIRTRSGARAQWKGCVEARAEPFDVTDDPPTIGNPNTQFTPYFWMDEVGAAADGNVNGYVNNYIDDATVMPQAWTPGGDWERTYNILKYDGASRGATYTENPPTTGGPNMACPDELLRLTDNRAAVLNKVRSLSHWNGGGTISSEGIAWGWRTLSPKAPFADGVAYGTPNTKKFLVLMTDGENELGESNIGGPTLSHYSAYGHLRYRFSRDNFQLASNYLDDRMSLVCENAKAAGVQVITILFRVNTMRSKNLLERCASDRKLFYIASNQNELRSAFQDVAAVIGRIRLTK